MVRTVEPSEDGIVDGTILLKQAGALETLIYQKITSSGCHRHPFLHPIRASLCSKRVDINTGFSISFKTLKRICDESNGVLEYVTLGATKKPYIRGARGEDKSVVKIQPECHHTSRCEWVGCPRSHPVGHVADCDKGDACQPPCSLRHALPNKTNVWRSDCCNQSKFTSSSHRHFILFQWHAYFM
jgi:hypothetical protein